MSLEQDLIVTFLFVFPLSLACIARTVSGFSVTAAPLGALNGGSFWKECLAGFLAPSSWPLAADLTLVGFPLSSHAASGGTCPMFMDNFSTEVSDSQDFRLLGNLQLHFQNPNKNKEASFQIVWWWYLILISSILRGWGLSILFFFFPFQTS